MDLGAGWVDWALLAVLGLSIVIGLVRGLVFELLSLAGWVVSYFAALWAAPLLAPLLPVGAPGSALNSGVAYACAFIAILVTWSLLSRLMQRLIRATPLRPIDRFLGAAFGFVRGGVLLLLLALLVSLTPAARSPAWQMSVGATWLNLVLQEMKPLLPGEAARHVVARLVLV